MEHCQWHVSLNLVPAAVNQRQELTIWWAERQPILEWEGLRAWPGKANHFQDSRDMKILFASGKI